MYRCSVTIQARVTYAHGCSESLYRFRCNESGHDNYIRKYGVHSMQCYRKEPMNFFLHPLKIWQNCYRKYIYTCIARSLILGLEMHICLLLQSSIWSKKCTRLQNRLAHIIYIYIKTHCQVVWNDCQEYNIQKTITAKEVLEIRNASASSSLDSSLKVS